MSHAACARWPLRPAIFRCASSLAALDGVLAEVGQAIGPHSKPWQKEPKEHGVFRRWDE